MRTARTTTWLAVAAALTALAAAARAPAGACPGDINDDQAVDVDDLVSLILSWGPCPAPCPPACDGDGNGDCEIDVDDLVTLILAWGPCAEPSNDACAGATAVGEGVTVFSNVGASIDDDDPPFACGDGAADLWFEYVAPGAGTVLMTTVNSGFDTVLEAYAGLGCPPDPRDSLACSDDVPGDDHAELNIRVAGGSPLKLRVGGAGGAEGVGALTVQFVPEPPDLDFFVDDPAGLDGAVDTLALEPLFSWSFEPDLLEPGAVAEIDDILSIDTHAANAPDVWANAAGVDLWPAEIDSVSFSSNTQAGGPWAPRGPAGLFYRGAESRPGSQSTLSSNFFVDSFDILHVPGAEPIRALRLEILIALGVFEDPEFEITVFDMGGVEYGATTVVGLDPGETAVLGIVSEVPIGRIDVWDIKGGAEGIASIAAWGDNPYGCPGAGPCNAANGTPGCDDAACCSLVCAADPSCCDQAWDQACADQAAGLERCPNPSGCPGSGPCNEAHGTPGCDQEDCCRQVCAVNPSCCDVAWEQDCVEISADVADCPNVFGCPGEGGDCCDFQEGPGCKNTACCRVVCELDPFCCDQSWDFICANEALEHAVCGCSIFDIVPCEDGACPAPDEGSWCVYGVVEIEQPVAFPCFQIGILEGQLICVTGCEGAGDPIPCQPNGKNPEVRFRVLETFCVLRAVALTDCTVCPPDTPIFERVD